MVFQCLGLGPKAYWAIRRWWHQQLVDGNGRDFYPSLCSEYPFSCLNKNLVIKWLHAPWELRWNLVQPGGISFWFSFFSCEFVGGGPGWLSKPTYTYSKGRILFSISLLNDSGFSIIGNLDFYTKKIGCKPPWFNLRSSCPSFLSIWNHHTWGNEGCPLPSFKIKWWLI